MKTRATKTEITLKESVFDIKENRDYEWGNEKPVKVKMTVHHESGKISMQTSSNQAWFRFTESDPYLAERVLQTMIDGIRYAKDMIAGEDNE